MNIQLTDWQVKELSFSVMENADSASGFSLETSNFFFENKENEFAVAIKVSIVNLLFNLNVETYFTFHLDEKITEDFKLSDFPKVNAPAIAFPYLRAYISNLTLQSGFEPVILPSINFVKLSEQRKKNGKPQN